MVSLRIQPSNTNDTAGLSCLMGSFPLYYNCDFQLNNSRVFLDPLRWKKKCAEFAMLAFFFCFCSLLTGDQKKNKFPSKVRQGSPTSPFFLFFLEEKGTLSKLLKEVSMFLGMNWESRHKIKWRGISAETTFHFVILWKKSPTERWGVNFTSSFKTRP